MEAAAVGLAIVALAMSVVASVLVWRWGRRWLDVSPSGARVTDLERRLAQASQRLEVVEAELDARHESGVHEGPPVRTSHGSSAISRIGLVRFDAFSDAGGAQSFALALVDDDGDGIVLTSLHSRPTTRVYVKTIRRGVADAPLSGEEVQALGEAGITS